jgi:hypothetical protein
VRRILAYLKKLPDCWARKQHGSAVRRGEADITGCLRGKRLELEVKTPGGDYTPLQAATARKWRRAGALAECVTSVEETKDVLREADLL